MAAGVIGYARLSTADQAKGLTLEQQVSRLQAAGATEVLIDLMTGKSTARPKYRELLRRITAGEVTKLISTRWDRICRSATETCRMVDVLTAEGAPELLLLDDPQDLSTIGGRAQLRMLGVFAQMEAERIRERAMAGKAYRRAKGMLDVAPFGLLIDVTGKLIPDRRPFITGLIDRQERSRADLVLEAFDQLEDGWSMYKPWQHLGAMHGVWLDRVGFNRLLLNPAFRGARVGGRDKNKGRWASVEEGAGGEALIDPDRHRRIVATVEGLRARRATPDRRHQHVLAGKVICSHCGRKMERAVAHDGAAPQYRCKNQECSFRIPRRRQNNLTEEKILKAVFQAFADQSTELAAAEERQALLAQEQAKLDPEVKRLQDKRQKYLMLLADGDPVQPVIDTIDDQIGALLSADHSQAGMTPLRVLREGCNEVLRDRYGITVDGAIAVELAWSLEFSVLAMRPWPEDRVKQLYADKDPLLLLIREVVREIRVEAKAIGSITLNV